MDEQEVKAIQEKIELLRSKIEKVRKEEICELNSKRIQSYEDEIVYLQVNLKLYQSLQKNSIPFTEEEKNFYLRILIDDTKDKTFFFARLTYIGKNNSIHNFLESNNILDLIKIQLIKYKNRNSIFIDEKNSLDYDYLLDNFKNNASKYNLYEKYPEFLILKGMAHTIFCFLLKLSSIKESDQIALYASGEIENKPITELYKMYERIGFTEMKPKMIDSDTLMYMRGTLQDIVRKCDTKNVPNLQKLEIEIIKN